MIFMEVLDCSWLEGIVILFAPTGKLNARPYNTKHMAIAQTLVVLSLPLCDIHTRLDLNILTLRTLACWSDE